MVAAPYDFGKMTTPTKSEDVDKEWLEIMLTNFENRQTPVNKVTIETWKLNKATKPEDSYQGDLYNLEVTATIQKNEETIPKKYHLNIKFTTQDTVQKEFNNVFKNPTREFLLHSKLLYILNEFQAKRTNNKYPICTPTYVYGEVINNIHILVTENVRYQGYVNKPKTELLSLNEAKIALDQLARVHSISYVYNRKKKFIKEYPMFRCIETLELFTSCQDHFLDIALEFLKLHKDHNLEEVKKNKKKSRITTDPETGIINDIQENNETTEFSKPRMVRELIMKIESTLSQIKEKNENSFDEIKKEFKKSQIKEKNESAESQMNKKNENAFGESENKAKEKKENQKIICLNHGDPWNTNVLIKNKSKSDISVCLTDWENVHWNTPVYDLNYFLAGALTPEVRLGHLDELLKHYHDHFTEVTKALHSEKKWSYKNFEKEFDYKNFEKEFDTVSVWGFLNSLRFTMTLSNEGKDIKILNKDPTTNCELELFTKTFGKAMVGIINLFAMDKFTIQMMRKFTRPVLQEMLTSRYPNTLNERFLANIIEGEARGFFDLIKDNNEENVETSPK